MALQLTGQGALVTGGRQGIGKAIARPLALARVDVALLARGAEPLATCAAALNTSEVAAVVLFLCSPRWRAINGDAIAVGGGAPRAIHD